MQLISSPSWVILLLLGAAWILPAQQTEGEDTFVKNEISKHSEALESLNRTQINALVWLVQETLDTLKGYQREAYKAVTPQFCPLPEAPSNGGVVCVNIRHIHYCKPMCNQGYDFSFLRRSRLYEKCGNLTGSAWTTQFVGGRRLADCIASKITVSGVPSAYFPGDSECQKTSGNSTAENHQIEIFLEELKAEGIEKGHDKKLDCILCGD